MCTCDAGYVGVVCARCDAGYHRDGTDACVADETCIPGLCGAHGECALEDGRAVCACALGYSGADCANCRAGYHAETDGTCTLDVRCSATTCAGDGMCSEESGRATCTCAAGRTGAFCEQTNATCEQSDPCGSHGTCSDFGGRVRCLCDSGYHGTSCDECYPGYARQPDQTCALGDSCGPAVCSFVGACMLSEGAASCTCPDAYSGTQCESCSPGFHRDPSYACVADETCAADSCSLAGECAVVSGARVCSCDDGYAGVQCESCYPGFHRDSPTDPCVLDTTCLPETCRFHGDCSEANGSVSCACDDGFTGDHCETNIDDCANSACGDGQCIDLIDSNVCLCSVPSNSYGEVCP